MSLHRRISLIRWDVYTRLTVLLAFLYIATAAASAQVLLGDQAVESGADSNAPNKAEAFQTTASLGGSVGSLTVYLDARSTATKLYLGLYADNNGHPGTLLSQASSTTLAGSAWNTIPIPPVSVVANTRYWIAILGTTGIPFFRDRASGSCKSEGSSQSTLTSLPSTWTTGTVYSDCPLSAYGSAITSSNPVLAVSPVNMAFTMTVGGADPAPITANVTNTGSGTLAFTASSDSAWLSVLPTSGTAPQSLQVVASGSGLGMGTYTGHVTVASPGSQGSPVILNASLTIAKPADWLMIDHDPARTGNAVDETIITPTNVGNLQLNWSISVDGPVTGQPLFAGGVQINGQSRNVLVAATGGNSVYAFDASTGAQLWKRNFGTQPANCAIPNGFGVTAAPLIDRSTARVYTVSNDGKLRILSLSDGTEALTALTLISQSATNKVWGGLNKVGNNIYVATASDGCDTTPWRGQVYKIDVSATPTLTGTFVVVPGIAAPNGGGGIWGYGGVSADSATGSVYAASGADSNMPEGYTPFADRMIALDGNLNLLGSYGPPEPNQFPCNGAPCDLDFGATPLVFQPDGCPTMVATGNKNGQLYVFKATDLAASAQPLQVLTLNSANDWLGSGGIGGVPAYWQAGNKVFISDVGPGVSGVAGGVVALNVTASCSLQVAWSTALGGAAQPDSTPTVANGVVFVGEGATGMVHAYDAQSGVQLWTSGSTAYSAAATYAAPIVAQGSLYVGSWSNFSGGGEVGAFSLNSPTQILSVSPTSVAFTAIQGGSNPASATINVTNAGVGTLTFNAASDSTWLTVSPASGSAPQNLQIGANVGGLAQGTYTGHITITSVGAQGSPAVVTVTLTISPVATTLSSLTLSPTTVIGGNSSTGTVTLSGPASAGGATVTLSSNSTSAQVPTSVSVLAGATMAVFTVTTSAVSGSTSATITGTYGTAQTATLMVNPPTLTSVTLNPTSVQGGVSSAGMVTLSGKAPAGGAVVTLSSSNTAAAQVLASTTVTTGATTAAFTVTTSAVSSSTPVTITGTYGINQRATLTVTPAVPPGTVLFGDQAIESQRDSNASGKAEAFQTTANATGTLASMIVYLDASSTASKVYLGLYADNNGHPGALLTQGNSALLTAGAWNTITVSPTNLSSGTKYWIAILGTSSGTPFFRDRSNGPCKSETSSQATLTALPATWSTGAGYTDCPISAYGQ
jgi:outer membrane protein assembly factor BamB